MEQVLVPKCDVLIQADMLKPEILNQPGYSFLATNYNLLYQCIMPNCKVTIANIRKHCDLSDEVEKEILESECARMRCQRLLNVMLENLNADKDYMNFCYLLFLSTVATDLACYLITKFQSDGHWDCTAKVHPELEELYSKYQAERAHKSNSPNAVTTGDQDELPCDATTACDATACDATASVDFGATFVARVEKLADGCKTGNRMHKRQRIHNFQQDLEMHDSVMHSSVHQLDIRLDSTSNPNNVDDASQNDSLLQSAVYILNTSNSNDNSNTSTVPQSDIIPESHDLITSVSEINTQSEFNTSSHLMTNNLLSHTESAEDVNHDQSTSERFSVPEILNANQDLQILKHKYAALLQKFPDTHLFTLECLQDYLTEDCICAVVYSNDGDIANKMMLDCMISKLSCKENLLDFFDQLEEITGEHDLASTINELRRDLQGALENANPGIQQPIPAKESTLELKSWFLTQTTLSDHCKGLLKKHYRALCHSLPEDVTKTRAKLLQYSRVLPSSAIEKIAPAANSETVNQKIVNFLIISCKDDSEIIHFCDLFEKLVENPFFIHNVEMLRNDFLTLDYTKPHEQAIEFANRNLPLDDQAPTLSAQQSSAHIQSDQSTAENNRTQDTAATAGGTTSKERLANQLKYTESRLERGLESFKPPTKPSVLIDRKELLDKLATAVVTSSLDPDSCNPSVIVTGAGGFGKTTLITAVCYHKKVAEHFTDGFLFIEIGPQPIDPASQLHQLYSRLTGGESFPRGNLRNLVEGVRSFTHKYYRNLLVLIDDVWEFEDVELILTAFSGCKTVLTSRKIELISPVKYVHITVDAMTNLEAFNLLTDQIINTNSLSENTRKLVTDLAQDLLLWPLLLFLVRGHINRNQQLYRHSFEKTIQEVQIDLYRNGLTAFDKNCLEPSKGRKFAIKACIEVSLDFLESHEKDKLIMLILYTGIGGSVPMSVLHLLWQVSKEDGKTCLEKLWSYGLVMSKQLLIPPQNNIQVCAEVHCSISTYIINSLSSAEVVRLSDVCEGLNDVVEALTDAFIQCYGCHPSQLDEETFVEYWKIRIEHDVLPFYLRRINMCAVIDPHKIIWLMDQILEALQQIPRMFQVLAELANEFHTIGKESKMLFKKTTKSSQKLNQVVAKYMYESDYKGVISTLQSYCSNYEIGKVASKSLELCGKVISKFGSQVHIFFVQKYQQLLMLTPEYHEVTGTTIVLARIELHIDLYKQIINALESKSKSQIQSINEYIKSGTFHEEERLVNIHHSIKLKRAAPDLYYS